MRKSYQDLSSKNRSKWVLENDSSQITLLISVVRWCINTEKAFEGYKTDKKSVLAAGDNCQKELEDLIILVQGKLDKPLRTRVMCMITLDTHGRDINYQL